MKAHFRFVGWLVSAVLLGAAGAAVAINALPPCANPIGNSQCFSLLESVLARCELATVGEAASSTIGTIGGDKSSHPGFAFSGEIPMALWATKTDETPCVDRSVGLRAYTRPRSGLRPLLIVTP